MTPINGILIPLGYQTIGGASSATVPAGTTHFAFGSSTNKDHTHTHILVGGVECVVLAGEVIGLWTRGYTPTIARLNETWFANEVAFYKISPNASFS
jgi:hypothetical protein